MDTTALRFKSEALRKLQLRLAWGTTDFAGWVGEALVRETLDALDIGFVDVDQSKHNIHPDLLACNGKRPDFILDTLDEDHIVLADAKYHKTDGLSRFALTVVEIEKYKNLKAYTERSFPSAKVDVLFFVYPQEALGESLAVFDLTEFDQATCCSIWDEEALGISLTGKLIHPKTGQPIA